MGVNPDKDVDPLTFASFRLKDQGLRVVGIAQGQFSRAKIIKSMRAQKIKPTKDHISFLYPMGSGMEVTFLDNFTMLFSDHAAVKASLDARDGNAQILASPFAGVEPNLPAPPSPSSCRYQRPAGAGRRRSPSTSAPSRPR